MDIPSTQIAEALLEEAGRLNPGPWVNHSQVVAEAARRIAAPHPQMDPSTAYILGLLHDVGRREGRYDMRHVLDGYRYLEALGYHDAARVCLTHSFPIKNVHAGAGKWDCPPEEVAFIQSYLDEIEFDVYDRLIQLCDALALPTGVCLIEKRLVDVALRHGFNDYTLEKWKAFLEIKSGFEETLNCSIYHYLPEAIENSF